MNTRTGADIASAAGARMGVKLLRLSAVLMLVNGVLLAPWWVLSGGLAPPWLSLEATVIVWVFTTLPRERRARYAAGAVALLVVLFTVIGFADTTMRLSLGRPLNLYVDLWLLRSVRDLLVGAFGPGLGVLGMILVPVAMVLATVLLGYCIASIRVDRAGSWT